MKTKSNTKMMAWFTLDDKTRIVLGLLPNNWLGLVPKLGQYYILADSLSNMHNLDGVIGGRLTEIYTIKP